MSPEQIRERLYILNSQIKHDTKYSKNGKPLKWYIDALNEIEKLEKLLRDKQG